MRCSIIRHDGGGPGGCGTHAGGTSCCATGGGGALNATALGCCGGGMGCGGGALNATALGCCGGGGFATGGGTHAGGTGCCATGGGTHAGGGGGTHASGGGCEAAGGGPSCFATACCCEAAAWRAAPRGKCPWRERRDGIFFASAGLEQDMATNQLYMFPVN